MTPNKIVSVRSRVFIDTKPLVRVSQKRCKEYSCFAVFRGQAALWFRLFQWILWTVWTVRRALIVYYERSAAFALALARCIYCSALPVISAIKTRRCIISRDSRFVKRLFDTFELFVYLGISSSDALDQWCKDSQSSCPLTLPLLQSERQKPGAFSFSFIDVSSTDYAWIK